jgi:oligopeptide transport system ATP-binding protein
LAIHSGLGWGIALIIDQRRNEARRFRREIQMIYQDPYSSLNPRKSVYDIIGAAYDIHGHAAGREKDRRIRELLEKVGMAPFHIYRYPHEFSGGQRQRVGIARALAVEPSVIFCDEPVSALDVSVRAQILNLLKDLQEEFGLTYVFISHDLAVVRHICNRVMVMYLGRAVEQARTEELFSRPMHPYTKALISAIPVPNPRIQRTRERILLEGEIPTPMGPSTACDFASRCPLVEHVCRESIPPLEEICPGHFVACFVVARKEEMT